MRLHTVRSGDWREYRAVRLAALREAPAAFSSTYDYAVGLSDEAWRQRARSSEEGERSIILLVGDNSDQWVGIAASYRPAEGADAELISMWVDPAARGQRLGARLIDAVISWAARHGDRTIGLWVNDRNHPAIKLYRRAGFTPTGESKPMPADPTQTEIRMLRPINGPNGPRVQRPR